MHRSSSFVFALALALGAGAGASSVFLGLSALFLAPAAIAADFPVVKSPAEPPRGTERIPLEELWSLSGEDEDVLLGVTSRIDAAPDGTTYFLDMQLTEIQVFSPEGEYLRSIGREGEGPGEFSRPSGMFLLPDGTVGVIQGRPGKVVLLTPTGEPAGSIPVPGTENGSVFLGSGRAANGRVYLQVNQGERTDTGFKSHNRVLGIDRQGTVLATYQESDVVRDFSNPVFDEKEGMGVRRWDVGRDGEYYQAASFDEYRVEVRNPDGTPRFAIEREFTPRKRSQVEKDEIQGQIVMRGRGRMQMEMKVSPTDPAILDIYPRPDGTLWVLPATGAYDQPAGVIATFDVYNTSGEFVRQVSLEGDAGFREDGLFFVGDDRFVVIRALSDARRAMFGSSEEDAEEDEPEVDPLSVVCYRLPSLAPASAAGN